MFIGYTFLEGNLGSDLKNLKDMPVCSPRQLQLMDIIVDV